MNSMDSTRCANRGRRAFVMTLLLLVSSLSCQRDDGLPLTLTVDDLESGVPCRKTKGCRLSLGKTQVSRGENVDFTIYLEGTKERRVLCLSYIMERPFRWLATSRAGEAAYSTLVSVNLRGEERYVGTPVKVVIPEGGYIAIRGVFNTVDCGEEEGRYVVWIEIPHLPPSPERPEIMEPVGWPEDDHDLWKGVVVSNKVEIEISDRFQEERERKLKAQREEDRRLLELIRKEIENEEDQE